MSLQCTFASAFILPYTINITNKICALSIYFSAIFLPPAKVDSLYELIWLVGVNDFILKFLAVIIKVVLVLAPAKWLPFQRRVWLNLYCIVIVELAHC